MNGFPKISLKDYSVSSITNHRFTTEEVFTPFHRYGFNGQEKDDEVIGEGNSLNFKYRVEHSRLGRFFAVDPLAWKYVYNSVCDLPGFE